MNYISIMKVFIGLVDHSRGIIQDSTTCLVELMELGSAGELEIREAHFQSTI